MITMKLHHRIISGITAVAISLTSLISKGSITNIPKVHASAQQRLETNIEFAKNKSFSSFAEDDLSDFTMEDLQMLGVFLSNFYAPYSTSIGKTTRDEDTDKMKSAMVNALSKQCNFDKQVAETFVEYIWDLALSTAQPLYIGLEEENYKDTITSAQKGIYYIEQGLYGKSMITDVGKMDKQIGGTTRFYLGEKFEEGKKAQRQKDGKVPANLYNFLMLSSGTNNPANGTYTENKAGYTKGEKYGETSVYLQKHSDYSLYWEDEGTNRRVWTNTVGVAPFIWSNSDTAEIISLTSGGSNQFTACTLAYALLCDNLAYGYGIGDSILSVDMDTFNSLSEEDKLKTDLMHANLYVDCFGDILCDTGAMQVVVVPACVNPYTWYNFDMGEESAGKYYNMCNLYALGEALAGHIELTEFKKPKATDSDALKKWKSSLYSYYTEQCHLRGESPQLDSAKFYEQCIKEDGDMYVYTPLPDSEMFEESSESTSGAEATPTGSATESVSGSKRRASTLNSLVSPKYSVYTGSDSLFNRHYFVRNFGDANDKIDENVFKNNENTKALFEIIFRKSKTDWSGISYKYFDEETLANRVIYPNWSTFCGFGNTGQNKDWVQGDYTTLRSFNSLSKNVSAEEIPHRDRWKTTWYNREYYWGAFNDIAVIDSVQAFESATQGSAIKGTNIFSTSGEVIGAKGIQSSDFSGIRDHNTFTKLSGSNSKQYILSIYLSYLYAFYDTNSGDERVVSFAFNKNNFPTISGNIEWGDIEVTNNELSTKVMSLALLWLHPSQGLDLITTWIKNKVSHVLTNWHQDLVGKANATSSTGSTKYLGFTGYVTIPNLGDLAWLSTAIDIYKDYVVYAVMLILILMLIYTAVGMMTWQKATLSTIIFALCAYLPPYLIDFTINTSNEISNKIYSEKFVYWALVQHEQYATELNSAVRSKDEWTYLNTIFTEQLVEQADNYAIVSVKWQCPKKENVSASVTKQMEDLKSTGSNGAEESKLYSMIVDTVNKQMSGEEFLDSANNQYLYRSYTDLGTYAKNLYQNGYVDRQFREFASASYDGADINMHRYITGDINSVTEELPQAHVLKTHILPYLFVASANNPNSWGNGVYAFSYRKSAEQPIRRNLSYAVQKGFSNNYGLKVNYSDFSLITHYGYSQAAYIGSHGGRQGQYAFNGIHGDLYDYEFNRRITDFWSSPSVNAIFANRTLSEKDKILYRKSGVYVNDLYGVPGEAFNTTLGAVMSGSIYNNRGAEAVTGRVESASVMGSGSVINYSLNNENLSKELGIVDDADVATLIFAQYTESPFMFFSFNLQDQLGAYGASRGTGATYKDLLLQKNNGYFYNTGTEHAESNNEIQSGGIDLMKDYMDMRSIFNIVIPYLKALNDVVLDYDKTHGLTLYEDIKLEYDSNGTVKLPDDLKAEIQKRVADNPKFTINGVDLKEGSMLTQEMFEDILNGHMYSGIHLDFLGDYYNKYIHNAEVSQLLNIYTPWVDLMYETSYAKPEKIYVNGKAFTVTDPLDPTTYYRLEKGVLKEGREMVFSRSEMAYYGLDYTDLTKVEQKIIDTSDDVYEELLQIIDYHNFSEEVLNTAMAMLETFAFNKNFSDTSIGTANVTLYPQNFELKNFSYDAYLRLILAGTLDRDLTSVDAENIYLETIKNSGLMLGVLFLGNDLLACVAIPALKLAFVIAIFIISLLMILVATVRIEIPLHKVVVESLVKPLFKFIAFTIGFAFIVSLFMYQGNTAVTGRKVSIISMQSPLLVTFFMTALNIALLIIYFKIAKGVAKDIKKYSSAVATSVTGAVGSLPSALATGLSLASTRRTRSTFSKSMRGLQKTLSGNSGGSGRSHKGNGNGLSDSMSSGANSGGINGTKPPINDKKKSKNAENSSGENKYNEKIKKSRLTATDVSNKAGDLMKSRRKNHLNAQLDLADKYEKLSNNEKLSQKKRDKYKAKYDKQWKKALDTESKYNDKNKQTDANSKSRAEVIAKTNKRMKQAQQKVVETGQRAVAPVSASLGVKKAQLSVLKNAVSFKEKKGH